MRRRLGLVFQETSVDGLLTVEENLLFAARLAGLGGRLARAAVADAIERTGLGDHGPASRRGSSRAAGAGWSTSPGPRCTSPTSSSSTSRPSASTPSTASGSGASRRASAASTATTILFSTHYLAEAEPADRVVLLARGPGGRGRHARGAPRRAWVTRSPRSRGRAPSGWRARCAAWAPRWSLLGTERGYRVGLAGEREPVVELAGAAPGIERFAFRPTSLEDVYFARTHEPARPRR